MGRDNPDFIVIRLQGLFRLVTDDDGVNLAIESDWWEIYRNDSSALFVPPFWKLYNHVALCNIMTTVSTKGPLIAEM